MAPKLCWRLRVIIISRWHCHSSQEITMLVQSSSLACQGIGRVIEHARFPRCATGRPAGFAWAALLVASPKATSLPGAALQTGTATGKVQCCEESDCLHRAPLVPPPKWYLSICLHRACFQLLGGQKLSDRSSPCHTVFGLKPLELRHLQHH